MTSPTLYLFWIAEYQDGTALPQFDPDTGEENLFSEVDQSRLVRFGWYSFPPELAKKVDGAVANPLLDSYVVEVPKSKTLVALRTTSKEVILEGSRSYGGKHEADEYVLGYQGSPLMHIYKDGRVELKKEG